MNNNNHVQIIDQDVLKTYGSKVNQLIRLYLAENDASLNNLCEAWENRDLDGTRLWAHKMAGSSKTVGAENVYKIAASIEWCVDLEDHDMDNMVLQLKLAFMELENYLAEDFKQTS